MLKSVGWTTLAMFRWTKTSPGSRSRIVVSGHLESEHPIHRISGDWPLARAGKRSGFSEAFLEAHSLFLGSAALYLSPESNVSYYNHHSITRAAQGGKKQKGMVDVVGRDKVAEEGGAVVHHW